MQPHVLLVGCTGFESQVRHSWPTHPPTHPLAHLQEKSWESALWRDKN